AWEANAAFWDQRMGEGNDWVERLCWPALTRLLDVRAGERILDVACGNGLTSRRLAALGATVLGFDFSSAMLDFARARTEAHAPIEYHQVDATDEAALVALGERSFDGALSNMALMDMAAVGPLYRGLARLLRPGGRFVFSVPHPAFNGAHCSLFAERRDLGNRMVDEYGVRVTGYLDAGTTLGVAISGQPEVQPYFHRPLHDLLGQAFEAGFVLDGLEEPAFGLEDGDERRGPNWNNLPTIPPVLVVRLRLPS
ncbi:MAG: class I SAM-dependent methyltransferase, partial [Dehalococcoidia bacterium]|nr:class I SAM-dependent methyltransferase [Dehalococcoidia bacterium]